MDGSSRAEAPYITATPTYAVMFKVHFWDDFARRQLRRLQSVVASGDIFILLDETKAAIEGIDFGNVLRLTEKDCLDAGLADGRTRRSPGLGDDRAGPSLLWYNTDYPHYLFFDRFPEYDFYLSFEYDVVTTYPMDLLVTRLRDDRVDYLGFPHRTGIDEWPWIEAHLRLYKRREIRLALSCFAVFSRRAMRLLRDRRFDMTSAFMAGTVPFWPNNEAFIPTEIWLAGLNAASLEDYGNTVDYDWWPPSFEPEVEAGTADRFWHPVLDEARYLKSVIRHGPNPLSAFREDSALSKKLKRFPAEAYRQLLVQEFVRRVSERLDRQLIKLGLRQSWLIKAESPARATQRLQAAARSLTLGFWLSFYLPASLSYII